MKSTKPNSVHKVSISISSLLLSNQPKPQMKLTSISTSKSTTISKRHKGYSSVQKSQIAPKQHPMSYFTQNENDEDLTSINIPTLNYMIDILWSKFIVYYQYERVFPLPTQFKKDPLVLGMKKDSAEDFELKLKTYFEIYKIIKDDCSNLVSMSLESSFLLKDAKMWIMHMKVMTHKYNYGISDLLPMFNRACENGCDIYLLFDFLITVLSESENLKEEIKRIMSDENEGEGKGNDKSKSLPKAMAELWFENKDYILKILKGDEDNKKMKKEIVNPFGVKLKDNTYEPNSNSEEEEDSNENNSNDSKKIMEVSNEADEEDSTIREKEPLEKGIKPISKQELKRDLTPQPSKNRKKEYYRAFNPETDLKHSKVIEDNICSNGNYALLELNPKIQESLGQKYVLTPIKGTINKKEGYDDRKFINEKYNQDYIYQPYTEELVSMIKKRSSSSHSNSKKTPQRRTNRA